MSTDMSRGRTILCVVYALTALIALIATWSQNVAYFGGGGEALGGFKQFVLDTKVNPATRSITVDIALIVVAAATFMVIEARKRGVRFVWAYVIGGFLIAISVTFPLFLLARERRLAAGGEGREGLYPGDFVGLGLVYAMVAWLSWIVLS